MSPVEERSRRGGREAAPEAARRRRRKRRSTRWTEKTEVARVCGREGRALRYYLRGNLQSEKNYAGFAETTLVYATDPGGRRAAHRAVRGPGSGRCLRVFQPSYVLRSFSMTSNLDRVQTRKDYLLYRPQSEISRINRMFIVKMYNFIRLF